MSLNQYSLSFCLFLSSQFALAAINWESEFENTHILTDDSNQTSSYNRLRVNVVLDNNQNWLLKAIIDNENTYNLSQGVNHNTSKVYRAYWQYQLDEHLISIGKQRIALGVGRIWNPIDIFNPINSTSVEVLQIPGVKAIDYEYAMSDTSGIRLMLGEKKYGSKIKNYLQPFDLGLIVIRDEKNNQTIWGYEIQSELLTTGIELRSEGGVFFQDNERYRKWIIGVEYAFENSLVLLAEYKQDTQANNQHFALSANYSLSPLTNINTLGIYNIDNHAKFYNLNIEHSLSDESSLGVGMLLHRNNSDLIGGENDDKFFIKYFVHF